MHVFNVAAETHSSLSFTQVSLPVANSLCISVQVREVRSQPAQGVHRAGAQVRPLRRAAPPAPAAPLHAAAHAQRGGKRFPQPIQLHLHRRGREALLLTTQVKAKRSWI